MRMKKILLIILALATTPLATSLQALQTGYETSQLVSMDDYKQGWDAGWDAGWKHVMGDYYTPPYPPYPAYPAAGRDTFQHGYNDGFLAGRKEALKSKG